MVGVVQGVVHTLKRRTSQEAGKGRKDLLMGFPGHCLLSPWIHLQEGRAGRLERNSEDSMAWCDIDEPWRSIYARGAGRPDNISSLQGWSKVHCSVVRWKLGYNFFKVLGMITDKAKQPDTLLSGFESKIIRQGKWLVKK